MGKTQAEQIREMVVTMLQNRKTDYLEQITSNVYGIQYIKLKKKLSEKFTEGAVTGCLNTITERVENVHKVKIKSGTYFYFSDKESSLNLNEQAVEIIYSKELEEVLQYSQKAYEGVSNILKKTAKDFYYSNVTTLDLDNLRSLLDNISQTENLLKKYKTDKAFENVENKHIQDLNNSSYDETDEDLPF